MKPLALALALSGCSLAPLVRDRAARDFSCPPSRIRTVEAGLNVIRAAGCGREALYNYAARSPIQRASFDLGCAPEQLAMVDLGDNAIGVEGCGRKVAYAFVDWSWVGTPSR